MKTKAKILESDSNAELEKMINAQLKKGYKIEGNLLYHDGILTLLVVK